MKYVFLAAVLLCGGLAHAQPTPPPGALACTGCHAGPGTAMPSLENRSAQDISAAMAAFRAGARDATVMDRIAKGFDDRESTAIAEWFANGGRAR